MASCCYAAVLSPGLPHQLLLVTVAIRSERNSPNAAGIFFVAFLIRRTAQQQVMSVMKGKQFY